MGPWCNYPPLLRFERDYIPEPMSGCWIWLGYIRPDGYGEISLNGHARRAHIFSYKTFVGPIPKGLCVLHNCDMRCCVNPDHLRVGTKKENTGDAIKRRRFPTGITHACTTLSEDDVRKIRNDSRYQYVIAEEFGVCQMTISNIKRRATWKYLP